LETPFAPLEIVFPKVPESSVLPANIETLNEVLKTLLASQQAACEQAAQLAYQRAVQAIRLDAHEYIVRMLEQAVLARQRMFGASSEQLPAQSRLFDEAEALAQSSTEAQDLAPIAAEVLPAVKLARGKRAPLPAQLERVDVVHDVPESDRTCPCGTPMVEIGQDISEQLDIVPIAKYACCATSASVMVVQKATTRPSPRPCRRSHCPRATPVPTSWPC